MKSTQNILTSDPLLFLPSASCEQNIQIPLKWTLNMSPESRRFYPFETLIYLDHFTLFIVKYTSQLLQLTYDKQQNKQHVRIILPQQNGKTNLNKIQIISIHPQTIVLVGFSNTLSLYRWTTGQFISQFSLPGNQQQIQWISNPEKLNNNCSFLTINTASQIFIVKINYSGQINVQISQLQRTSLFKSITSFFKPTTNLSNSKSFTFSIPDSEDIYSLIVNNNNWSLYRVNAHEVVSTKQWERQFFDLANNSTLVDLKVGSYSDNGSFYLIVYALSNESRNIKLSKIVIDIDDGRNKEDYITLKSLPNSYFEMNLQNGLLYLTNNNYSNKSSIIYIFDTEEEPLALKRQESIDGNIVLGDKIIITETQIYQYLNQSNQRRDSGDMRDQSFLSKQQSKLSLQNKQSLKAAKQFQRVSKASHKFQSILQYQHSNHDLIKLQITKQIQELQNILNKSKQFTNDKQLGICIRQLIFKQLQLQILSDLKNHSLTDILADYYKPRHVEQFFKNTEDVLSVLAQISTSGSFLYFCKLIQLVYSKLSQFEYLPNYDKIEKQLSSSIFPILLQCAENFKFQQKSSEQMARLKEIMRIVGESDLRYFDYLFFCKNYREYYQISLKYSYDFGIIRLYVQTNQISGAQLKNYIQSKGQPDFINQLTIQYFESLEHKKVPKLKLLIDLPEYVSKIHQIIQHRFPKYCWLTALSTKQYTNDLQIKMRNIGASQPINYKTILSIQNDGNYSQSLNIKQNIANVCQTLGWKCVADQQFLNIVRSKSQKEISQIAHKLAPSSVNLQELVKRIQNVSE